MNMLPVLRDISSMLKGQDIERPDMALIQSLITTVTKAIKAEEDVGGAWFDVVLSVGNLFGMPLKNIFRDAKGVARLVRDVTDDISPDDMGAELVRGFLNKELTKGERIFAAIVDADAGKIARLKAGYKTDGAFTSAVRSALRECDGRIHEAALARYEGDILAYMQITKEIIREGHFLQDDIVAAIMSEVSKIKTEREGKQESSPGSPSMYNAEDYLSVVGVPDSEAEVWSYLVQRQLDKGKSQLEAEKAVRTAIADEVKEDYELGELGYDEALDLLIRHGGYSEEKAEEVLDELSCAVETGVEFDDILNACYSGEISEEDAVDLYVEYGGYEREAAEIKVECGLWRSEHPDYMSLTDDAILRFKDYCEPEGVSAEIFFRAKEYTRGVEGDGTSGSVKRQYLDYIYSLGLPYEMQRALWYAIKNKSWSDGDTPF